MSSDGTLGLLPHPSRNRQRVANADADNPEDLLYRFDVALDVGPDLVGSRRNVAHFQCAGKGAEQSSPDRSHHVIKRGWNLFLGLNPVELLDPSVDPKSDRRVEPFEKRLTNRSLHPLDLQTTGMDDFSHC